MNSRQIEEQYKNSLELLQKQVKLGELSQDEAEFFRQQAHEKYKRQLSKLRRPGRKWFFIFALMAICMILFGSYRSYRLFFLHSLSYFPLLVFLIGIVFLIVVFYLEVRRLEGLFSRFFSQSYLKKILYSPEIEFEYSSLDMIQLRLEIKNLSNLYAGLKDTEIADLLSRILSVVSQELEDGKSVIEQVGMSQFVINWDRKSGVDCAYVIRRVQSVFTELKSMDGQFFSKSVRMGAGIVTGLMLNGNLGEKFQIPRTFGKKCDVCEALSSATGWEEVFVEEEVVLEQEKNAWFSASEPIYMRSSNELIKVFRFQNWKDG